MARHLPLCTLLALTLLGAIDAQNCTLCEDGSEPNLLGMIGSGTCEEVYNSLGSVNIPRDSNDCRVLQVQGYINCDCPTYPDVYCSVSHEFEVESLSGSF